MATRIQCAPQSCYVGAETALVLLPQSLRERNVGDFTSVQGLGKGKGRGLVRVDHSHSRPEILEALIHTIREAAPAPFPTATLVPRPGTECKNYPVAHTISNATPIQTVPTPINTPFSPIFPTPPPSVFRPLGTCFKIPVRAERSDPPIFYKGPMKRQQVQSQRDDA